MNDEITKIKARQVLDSRANPTVEVEVTLKCGAMGRGTVPSGASTGAFEVLDLRDNGQEYGGKSVRKAIKNIEKEIGPMLLGQNATSQADLDRQMIALD